MLGYLIFIEKCYLQGIYIHAIFLEEFFYIRL